MDGTSTSEPARLAPERADAGYWSPVLVYAGTLAVLLVVSWQTISRVTLNPLGVPGISYAGDWFWGGWLRFDGGWYHSIAESGYFYLPGAQSSVAFFPGYPIAIRGVGRLIGNVPLGGILTTIGCGFASTILYWRWTAARLDRSAAVIALLTFAFYPYAYYLYGAVYGDALFLVAVLAAFVLLEHDRPMLAGLAGAAATATRFVGIAVVVGLVIGILERRGAFEGSRRWGVPRRIAWSRLRPGDAGVLLSLAGLAVWIGWLWHRFGDPFLFSSVQEAWGQPSSPRTWFKEDFFSQLIRGTDRIYVGGLVVQAFLALGVLLLVPGISRRFGLRYAAYTLVLVVVPGVGSQDFQGVGRYLIAAFPAFALVGERLAGPRRWWRLTVPVSFSLLLLATAWFAHGLYLA